MKRIVLKEIPYTRFKLLANVLGNLVFIKRGALTFKAGNEISKCAPTPMKAICWKLHVYSGSVYVAVQVVRSSW